MIGILDNEKIMITKKNKVSKRRTLGIFGLISAIFFTLFLSGASVVSAASGYIIEDADVEIVGDFVLERAKFEATLHPGETVIETIGVINRTDRTVRYTIDVEDFSGSADGTSPVNLLGAERGPYSLKDYFNPHVWEFTLEPKQRIKLPVEIVIPEDAEPGGLFGSVIVVSNPEIASGNPIISRLASLFFVRVSGDIQQEGKLDAFTIQPSKKIYTSGAPTGFSLTSSNAGSVHLNSYGVVRITNSLGVIVKEVEVEPYFTLPGSVRSISFEWSPDLLIGRYTATALINRGYDDVIDEMSASFWIMPTGLIVKWFIGILIFILLLRLVFSKFEIRSRN